MLKKHFYKVLIEHDNQPFAGAVLLIGNHFSWWDGFIANYLNFTVFKKRFHVMMLEEQLESRMFLNKAGAFSIKKSSRSAIESLSYASEILSCKDNMLVMFPQGVFKTLYTRSFTFEPGIEKILDNLTDPPDVWFMVNLVEYFSQPKPSLFIRTKKHDGGLTRDNLQEAYTRFFNDCVARQTEDLI